MDDMPWFEVILSLISLVLIFWAVLIYFWVRFNYA